MSAVTVVAAVTSALFAISGYLSASNATYCNKRVDLVSNSKMKTIKSIIEEGRQQNPCLFQVYAYTFRHNDDPVITEFAPISVALSRVCETSLTDEPVEVPGPTYNARGKKIRDTHTEYKRSESLGPMIYRGSELAMTDDERFIHLNSSSDSNTVAHNPNTSINNNYQEAPPRSQPYLSCSHLNIPENVWRYHGESTTYASNNVNVNISINSSSASELARPIPVGVQKTEWIIPKNTPLFIWGNFTFDHRNQLTLSPYIDNNSTKFDPILSYQSQEQVVDGLQKDYSFWSNVSRNCYTVGSCLGTYALIDFLVKSSSR